ncbi:acyl-CoA thioesterase [Halorubrum sp. DTA98]|uniref:acyl-CoA thioesterase n=1 Tax=Halorubrum sp. DTA98 TaxID=3402163 RepID=UPI003AAD31A2
MSTYSTEIEVRFRDIDSMGHVNNAVYATYIEQARARYFGDVLETDLSSISTVLAALSLEFRKPIELSDGTVTVDIDVPELGRSSVPMTYELRTTDGVAATAESTQVTVDPDSGESRPIPDAYRERIRSYHDL